MDTRIDIHKDLTLTKNAMYVRLDREPSVTCFKKIAHIKTFTHFRRWIETLSVERGHNILLNKDKYNVINGIWNMLFVVDLNVHNQNHDSNFDSQFIDNKLSIKLRLGDVVIFDQDCYGLLNIFKSYSESYNRSVSIYNSTKQLIIPLQQFIMEHDQCLNVCHYKNDLIMECNYNSDYANKYCVTFEAFQYDDAEYKRNTLTANEQYINGYHTQSYRIPSNELVFKIPVTTPTLLRHLTVFSVEGNVRSVTIDQRPFTRLSDPYNRYYRSHSDYSYSCTDSDNNTFVYDTHLTMKLEQSNNINVGFITGSSDRFITVQFNNSENSENVIVVTYKYDNFLRSTPEVLFEFERFNYDYSHNYPLTKISDTEFVEGYWYNNQSDDKETRQYPFPKPEAHLQRKNHDQFINKLKQLVDNKNVFVFSGMFGYDESGEKEYKQISDGTQIKFVHCMGGSWCRLCQNSCNCDHEDKTTKRLGGTEGIIVKNNITYRFPEGVLHYYKDHDVQPSQEFFDLIMSLDVDLMCNEHQEAYLHRKKYEELEQAKFAKSQSKFNLDSDADSDSDSDPSFTKRMDEILKDGLTAEMDKEFNDHIDAMLKCESNIDLNKLNSSI